MQLQPHKLVERYQERIARLKQENKALRTEIVDLRQQLAIAEEKNALNRAIETVTIDQTLPAEIPLRQRSEAALGDSDRLFRYTFEQAAVGMTITDLNGRWLLINQKCCNMVGYSKAEMLALTFVDMIHPDDLADSLAAFPHLVSGELSFFQAEKRYICKDGSYFWANTTVSAVRDAVGDPVCFVTIVQDISSRKEAELVGQGQQDAVQSSLAYLASEPELDKFLSQVLATILEQLHAPVADIWLNDVQTATKHLTRWNTKLVPNPADAYSPPPIPLSAFEQGSAFETLHHQHQPFVYSDLPNHPDFEIFKTRSAVRDGVQTMLLVPLVFGKDILGICTISHFQSHPYPPEALHLVTALAQQVVLAIQLTRLAEDAKQVALLEEHNRLAREIHDTLAQTFNSISLQLNNAQYYASEDSAIAWEIVEQVKNLAHSGLVEARRSVWSLHPDAEEYRNLAESLQRSLSGLTLNSDLQTDFKIVGTPQPVSPDIGMNLLRIGQEAINNTLRHAQAQTLQIELTFKTDEIVLRIQDNGRGFNPQVAWDRGGFGLIGMQQRCERLGGQLTFQSQPKQGTCILVQISLTC